MTICIIPCLFTCIPQWISSFSGLLVICLQVKSEVAQSCPTLCNPMACSPPGSSVHGVVQARELEWVVISFSRGSSRPRDQTWVSRIAGRRFTIWATREALCMQGHSLIPFTPGAIVELMQQLTSDCWPGALRSLSNFSVIAILWCLQNFSHFAGMKTEDDKVQYLVESHLANKQLDQDFKRKHKSI